MDSPIDWFCVSWFTQRVANAGAAQAVQAWNEHPLPGRLLMLVIAIVYLCNIQLHAACIRSPESYVVLCIIYIDNGIPNVKMQQDNRAAYVSPSNIPSPEEAVASYQRGGGRLTLVSTFGDDPLSPSLDAIRQQEFLRCIQHFSLYFTLQLIAMNVHLEMVYSTSYQLLDNQLNHEPIAICMHLYVTCTCTHYNVTLYG